MGVGVSDGFLVGNGVGVREGVKVKVGVGVRVAVDDGVSVNVAVGVRVGVKVGVAEGVEVNVAVWVGKMGILPLAIKAVTPIEITNRITSNNRMRHPSRMFSKQVDETRLGWILLGERERLSIIAHLIC